MRGRVGAGVIGGALVLGLTLGACSQSNTPDAYDTLTEQNFLETCTNFYFDNTDDSLSITDNTVTDDTVVEPWSQESCECQYRVFAGPTGKGDGTDGGMPINASVAKSAGWNGPNFTDLNADLKNDPQKAWDELPQEFKDGIAACQRDGGSSSGSTSSSTTSTTVATDESTTTSGA